MAEQIEERFEVTVKWFPTREEGHERYVVDYLVKTWATSFDDGGLGRKLADTEIGAVIVHVERIEDS